VIFDHAFVWNQEHVEIRKLRSELGLKARTHLTIEFYLLLTLLRITDLLPVRQVTSSVIRLSFAYRFYQRFSIAFLGTAPDVVAVTASPTGIVATTSTS
jgi:hypothetical protein